MSIFKGPLKSSANAGQLSRDLAGKVGIKQYYNGALRMVGVEPIPQAGFGLLPGSRYIGAGVSGACKKAVLKVSADRSYVLVFTVGRVDIWRNDGVKVANVAIAQITAVMVPDLGFYAEADTVGVFHPDLNSGLGLRILRDASNDAIWTYDAWPFTDIPKVDLGGTYPQTVDRWDISVRWANSAPALALSCTVDGANAASVTLAVAPGSSTGAHWDALAAALAVSLSALPGFSSGVGVSRIGFTSGFAVLSVVFDGPLKGSEYEVGAQVVNTSDASALVSHIVIGKTEGEGLVSATRGGFAGMELYQDRAVYYGPKARPSSLAQSQPGEYFNLNIESQADNGPRLDALRSQTSETIRFVLDNTYLVVLTDQAEWFASNRTVSRNEPMNFVRASEIGVKKNCRPVILEGDVYFMSKDGGVLYSISYDAVSTTYVPSPQNDLNKDLVAGVRRQAVQRKIGSTTSNRLWELREDGRLICLVVNKTQEILAACEWPVAGGGLVKEIAVDGQEQVWVTVDRNGEISEEMLEEAGTTLLQSGIDLTTDLTGYVFGLSRFNGRQVWAEIDGDVLGPFTVDAGFIATGAPAAAARVGLWSPPIYESMPYVQVLPDDSVVRRPGSVKAAKLYLIDTTSIAIGANGQAAKNVPLNRMSDDLAVRGSGFTGHHSVLGLKGATMDPTFVITQTRPGRLRVRDYIPGVKL
ncbi:hypothetical protein HF272_13755 [Rhizobium leguminosarum]|uniref:hypothetical protein n=1 Tax=Rhizobium leguminosarum TaxID=384 RepID=UPI001C907813|nr:hypothetical protein [Rhizobium leguminosarum]MBY2992495.1 hypothetical protein [Rhizobium leguminosarum]